MTGNQVTKKVVEPFNPVSIWRQEVVTVKAGSGEIALNQVLSHNTAYANGKYVKYDKAATDEKAIPVRIALEEADATTEDQLILVMVEGEVPKSLIVGMDVTTTIDYKGLAELSKQRIYVVDEISERAI